MLCVDKHLQKSQIAKTLAKSAPSLKLQIKHNAPAYIVGGVFAQIKDSAITEIIFQGSFITAAVVAGINMAGGVRVLRFYRCTYTSYLRLIDPEKHIFLRVNSAYFAKNMSDFANCRLVVITKTEGPADGDQELLQAITEFVCENPGVDISCTNSPEFSHAVLDGRLSLQTEQLSMAMLDELCI